MRAHRLGDRDAEQPDRAGAGHHHALARDQAAEFGQAVHRGAGGDDQRRFLVRHVVGDRDQRVDVVDLVLAEAAVGGEAVGAMALVDVAVVQAVVVAGGVHALAAALALAAAGVDFHRDALADLVFVDAGAERHHGAHVFVAGREVLVERHAALDRGRRTVIDDLEIGRADRHRVDAHQHLGPLRHRHRLVLERELAGIAEHPGLHGVRNRIIRARLHSGSARTSTAPVRGRLDMLTCRPEPSEAISKTPKRMADHTDQMISIRGCRIRLMRGGSGPPAAVPARRRRRRHLAAVDGGAGEEVRRAGARASRLRRLRHARLARQRRRPRQLLSRFSRTARPARRPSDRQFARRLDRGGACGAQHQPARVADADRLGRHLCRRRAAGRHLPVHRGAAHPRPVLRPGPRRSGDRLVGAAGIRGRQPQEPHRQRAAAVAAAQPRSAICASGCTASTCRRCSCGATTTSSCRANMRSRSSS